MVRILRFTAFVALAMCGCLGWADDSSPLPDGHHTETIGDYTWSFLVTNGVSIICTSNSSGCAVSPAPNGELSIPATLGGCPVTVIGEAALREQIGISSVAIPEYVEKIEARAFSGCTNLEEVLFSSEDRLRTIGEYAFCMCSSLAEIELPEGVTSIGDGVFKYCYELTTAQLPDTLLELGESAFESCYLLVSGNIPAGISTVPSFAFYYSSLSEIDIPEGVTSIGEYAFYYCESLTDVNIPQTVCTIGEGAFYGCSALGDEVVYRNGWLLTVNGWGLESVVVSDGTVGIAGGAFASCRSLTNAILPETVRVIGDYVFDSTGITELDLPSGMEEIGAYAFNCTGLKTLRWPSQVPVVREGTFVACANLLSVILPAGVTNIGSAAFANCSALTNLTFQGNAPSVEEYAFCNVSSNCTVYVLPGTTGWNVDIPGSWNGLRIEYADYALSAPPFTASASSSQVYLWWDSVPCATWYKIYRASAGDLANRVLVDQVAETYWLDSDVESGARYVYWLEAGNDDIGAGPMSDPVEVEVLNPLRIVSNRMPNVRIGDDFEWTLQAEGGIGEYTWCLLPYAVDATASNSFAEVGQEIEWDWDETEDLSYDLPFEFPVGDEMVSNITINADGGVYLNDANNTRLFAFSAYAMFTTDAVYVDVQPNGVTFRWESAISGGAEEFPINASITLYRDGRIKMCAGNFDAPDGWWISRGYWCGSGDSDVSFYERYDGDGHDLWLRPTPIPEGVDLSSEGVLSGTPSACGDYSCTVMVTDFYSESTTGEITWSVVSTGKAIASIDDIMPSAPMETDNIILRGHADGEEAIGFLWRAAKQRDDESWGNAMEISRSESAVATLPAGTWRIEYLTQDADGVWSAPSVQELVVGEVAHLPDVALYRSDIRFFDADGHRVQNSDTGKTVSVSMTVRNLGSALAEGDFVIYMCDGILTESEADAIDDDSSCVVASAVVGGIAEGSGATCSMNWEVGRNLAGEDLGYSEGARPYTFVIRSLSGEEEVRTANNLVSAMMIIGDPRFACELDVSMSAPSTCLSGRTYSVSGQAWYDWLGSDFAAMGSDATLCLDGEIVDTTYTTSPDGDYYLSFCAPTAGVHTVTVKVSDGYSVGTASREFVVQEPTVIDWPDVPVTYLPNLYIRSFETTGDGVYRRGSWHDVAHLNGDVGVRAIIANGGNSPVTNSFLVVVSASEEGSSAAPTELGRIVVSNGLDVGETVLMDLADVPPTGHETVWTLRVTADALDEIVEHSEADNSASRLLTVLMDRPDLTCETPSFSASKPVVGDAVTVSGRVNNYGQAATEDAFLVGLYIDDVQVETWEIDASLAVGDGVDLSYAYDSTGLAPGTHTFRFTADIESEVEENGEDNNSASAGLYFYPPYPVVYPYALSATPYPSTDNACLLTASIRNDGGERYAGGTARFYIGSWDEGSIGSGSVGPIAAKGGSTTSTCVWTPTTGGKIPVTVEVEGRTYTWVFDLDVPPPDLRVLSEDLSLDPGEPAQDDLVRFRAMVRNVSTLTAATNASVTFAVTEGETYETLTTVIVPYLAPGGSLPVDADVRYRATSGLHVLKVSVLDGSARDATPFNNEATRSFGVDTPVAEVENDEIAGVLGESVSLVCTATNGISAWEWEVVERPAGSTAALNDSDRACAQFVPDVVGIYRFSIVVTRDGVESEPVEVELNATEAPEPGEFIPPDWEPVEQEDTMLVYAAVSNRQTKTMIEADGSLLAAFDKDGQCRGKTAIMVGPRGKLYALSVGVASVSEQGFSFKLWNAATGEIIEIGEILDCNEEKKYGSLKSPKIFAVGSLTCNVTLKEGWNWISTGLAAESNAVGTIFAGVTFANDDVVKSSSGMATYYDGNWYPSNFALQPGSAYMVYKSAGGDETVVIEGDKMTDGISVKAGWNWIGSPLLSTQKVSNVVHSGGYDDDDVFKDSLSFTTYCGGDWYPNGFKFVPCVGYKAYLANAGKLTFAGTSPALALAAPKLASAELKFVTASDLCDCPGWEPVTQENTLRLYLQVSNDVAKTWLEAEGTTVAAFDGDGQCRGKATIEAGPVCKVYQLSIGVASTTESGFTLKVWDASTRQVYDLVGTIAANSDLAIGGIATPVAMMADVPAADPIPDLGENPTTEEITNVFVEAKAQDPKLAEKITTEAAYTNFSAWAKKVQPHGGGDAVGAAGVMAAPNAWVSYALGSETLLEAAPTDADLTVEAFEPKSGEGSKFDFTVSVEGVDVGSAATTEAQKEQVKENLKQVLGLEGGTTLEEGGMSSANVEIEFGTPQDGKVKFTAGPKDTDAKTFFMKVKVK